MRNFCRNSNHHCKGREEKTIFQTILIIIFWDFTMFEHKPDQPKVKRNLLTSKAKLVYKLPHELPNELRLTMLRNKEILVRSQLWVERLSSAQSPLHKFNFASSSQKTCKSRYQTFLVLFIFTGFLNFIPNILPRIVVRKSISASRNCHPQISEASTRL